MSQTEEFWTKQEIETHIKKNIYEGGDDTVSGYGAAIIVGALFKKLYGVHPSIGLSGFQGDAITSIVKKLPDKLEIK